MASIDSGMAGSVWYPFHVSEKHSNAQRMPAGFSGLQGLETRLVAAGFERPRPRWILEVAPTASASPQIEFQKSRVLVDAMSCCWPFRAELERWPLDDDSVPGVLLRHVWQPALRGDLLAEAVRVLKPGGTLVSVSANPWHRLAWRELGRAALRLPSWPQFQWMHARLPLQLSISANLQVRGLVPGLVPVLVVVATKSAEPARIEPIRFRQPRVVASSAVPSQCRAA
jgi:SAM-dependent methyltransferase